MIRQEIDTANDTHINHILALMNGWIVEVGRATNGVAIAHVSNSWENNIM
jgi:hypothetical protein